MGADLKGLISRLNPYCTHALEAASGLCVNRSHYEVAMEHMLLQLMEDPQADIHLVLRHFEIEPAHWIKQLQQQIENIRDGNPGKPVFSTTLLSLFKDSWMMSSVQLDQAQIRSAALLAVLAENPFRYGADFLEDIDKISVDEIIRQFPSIAEVSTEETKVAVSPATGGGAVGGSALEKYTANFTEKARNGEIDPVFGRDREIRHMIDILGRRRKNNPIVVGEAGDRVWCT